MKKRIISSILTLSTIVSCVMPSNFITNAAEEDFRAAWISTVYNMDFPKTKNNVSAQKNEFISILDKLKSMGMNAVVVQVRPKADALYESAINPWSDVLTGTQGKNPGYDPLAFMVEEAHKRGMEFHAWLNPYRVTTSGTDLNALASNHPARKDPSMVFEYDGALYYDPASKTVQKHIADTVEEIVRKYDVDAIHFDDYFYPNNYPLPAGEDKDGPVANQRRQNVNDMVSLVSRTIKQVNPNVKFGISPVGIWKNNYPDKTGSATRGNESYYAVFADTRTWIRNGWIDYVVPQLYWNIGHSAADYKVLVEWWSNEVKGTGVDLYIGQGVYKNEVASEIKTQLELNRKYSEIKGSVFFTTRDLLSNVEGCADSIREFYGSEPSVPDTSLNGEIVTYDVNLRTKADYSSEVLATIKIGQKVEILGVSGEFCKIKYNGLTGYVVDKYVKRLSGGDDTSTQPKPEPPKPEEPKPEPPKPEPAPTTKKVGTVTASSLNVRSGAGTNYSVITKLSKGTKVDVIDSTKGWYKIKMSNGKTGWVSGDYLTVKTETITGGSSSGGSSSSGGTTSSKKVGTVTASSLNVRSGAGTNYSVITKLSKGTKVDVIDSTKGWYKIKMSNGKTGWVSGEYLTVKTETTTGGSSGSGSSSTTTKTGTVTASTLNIRSGAGTNYSVVTKVSKGSKVTILETKSGWYKVKTSNGKTGWGSAEYIKK